MPVSFPHWYITYKHITLTYEIAIITNWRWTFAPNTSQFTKLIFQSVYDILTFKIKLFKYFANTRRVIKNLN